MDVLREDMARADRAESFLRSDFWKKDLEPYLFKEHESAKEACLWAPSDQSTIDKVALRSAYYSGGSASIERLVASINEFIVRGQEARKAMESQEEK